MKNQIVSRKRVIDHGEVLTNEREVNAMLDLVKHETDRIESRFLEPACGTGNFLGEILKRKLAVVRNRYQRSQLDYERQAVLAISSVYGIDILEDNVMTCRCRLSEIFDCDYTTLYKRSAKDECRKAVQFILDRNIIWGDALDLKTVDEHPCPIIFSEWSLARGSMLVRRDFAFKELLDHESIRAMPLFSDLGEQAFIPTPVKEFPPTHFLEIANARE
jgi:hypothetical protein